MIAIEGMNYLPVELLQQSLELLDDSNLYKVSLTSKDLNKMARRVLYNKYLARHPQLEQLYDKTRQITKYRSRKDITLNMHNFTNLLLKKPKRITKSKQLRLRANKLQQERIGFVPKPNEFLTRAFYNYSISLYDMRLHISKLWYLCGDSSFNFPFTQQEKAFTKDSLVFDDYYFLAGDEMVCKNVPKEHTIYLWVQSNSSVFCNWMAKSLESV